MICISKRCKRGRNNSKSSRNKNTLVSLSSLIFRKRRSLQTKIIRRKLLSWNKMTSSRKILSAKISVVLGLKLRTKISERLMIQMKPRLNKEELKVRESSSFSSMPRLSIFQSLSSREKTIKMNPNNWKVWEMCRVSSRM